MSFYRDKGAFTLGVLNFGASGTKKSFSFWYYILWKDYIGINNQKIKECTMLYTGLII